MSSREERPSEDIASQDAVSIVIILALPKEWPPEANINLPPQTQMNCTITPSIDTYGRILFAVSRDDEVSLHIFAPLRLDGCGRDAMIAFTIRWNGRKTNLFIGRHEVPSYDEQQQEVCLTLPEASTEPQHVQLAISDIAIADQVSSPFDRLFVRMMIDLAAKTLSSDWYDLVRAAGVLRALLVDGTPGMDRVNSTRRKKIRFRTLRQDPLPADLRPVLHFRSFDPSRFPFAPTIMVNRKDFIATTCLSAHNRNVSIADVIRLCANAYGGVHIGLPDNDRETAADLFFTEMSAGRHEAVLEIVREIARVTLVALSPLVEAIARDNMFPA